MGTNIQSVLILNGATATGAGETHNPAHFKTTYQALGTTSSGTGAATVLIQVSNDNSNWLTLGTITLTLGTSATSDGFAADASWRYCRANVSSISGTGAAVSVYLGSEVD